MELVGGAHVAGGGAAAIDVAVAATPDYGPTLEARNAAALAAQGTGWGIIATGDSNVGAASP